MDVILIFDVDGHHRAINNAHDYFFLFESGFLSFEERVD